jgi:hypothetical protein
MTATVKDAERAIHAALVQLKAHGEIATGSAAIEAAVKRLVLGETEEAQARDLVAQAVTALRRRGAITASDGPWKVWTIDDDLSAPGEELNQQETVRG